MSEVSPATHNVMWRHATVTRVRRERMNDRAPVSTNYEKSCYIIKNKCSHNWCDMEITDAVLFGKTRQAVLALLFERSAHPPDRNPG